MAALSADPRRRVVDAYDARGGTRGAAAARFKVSYSWDRKALRRRRLAGSIGPLPHGGGRSPAFDGAAARLRDAAGADDDATPAELAEASGVACRISDASRALGRPEVTRRESPGGRPSKTGRS